MSHSIHGDLGEFNSPTLDPGDFFTVAFDKPGVIHYTAIRIRGWRAPSSSVDLLTFALRGPANSVHGGSAGQGVPGEPASWLAAVTVRKIM
jgi:hypothetical protein